MFPPRGPVVQLVRMPACHAGGQGFEPPSDRHFASVAQLVEQGTENPRVVGSIPIGGTISADLAHLVERDLAKVEVAGSSPVIRSIWRHGQAVRHGSAKPLSPVRFRVAPPSVPVLKDAGRKTRDFLGFSSFSTVFLTFLKIGF